MISRRVLSLLLCKIVVIVVFIIVSAIIVNGNEEEYKITKQEQKAFNDMVKVVTSKRHGGYVHPSIGLVAPGSATGAPRGIGIVKELSTKQQEALKEKDNVLIKVPYTYQLTRQLALDTLTELIPATVLILKFMNHSSIKRVLLSFLFLAGCTYYSELLFIRKS